MKVLHIAYTDTAGSPGRWAMADARIGEETRLLVETPHPFRYRTPIHTVIKRWSSGNAPLGRRAYPITEHLRWADRLVVYEHPYYVTLAKAVGKPYIFRALGTVSKDNRVEIKGMCREDKAKMWCDTHELVQYGFDWLGSPIYLEAYPPLEQHDGFRVAHAPSNRAVKGTQRVIDACNALGVELHLIEGQSWQSCVYRKAMCDVLVDQVEPEDKFWRRRLNGYGVNGLEAMAMGQPVIGWASDRVTELQMERFGALPYVHTDDDLKGAIELMQHPPAREHRAEFALEYIKQMHDPFQQAIKVIERC